MSKKSSTFASAFRKIPFGVPGVKLVLRWGGERSTSEGELTEWSGELTEWSKVPHSKCGVRITSYRGFESLTLRLKRLGASQWDAPNSF